MSGEDRLARGAGVGQPITHRFSLAPQVRRRMVESMGNAPTWSCLQSRCITCLPRPRSVRARRCGARSLDSHAPPRSEHNSVFCIAVHPVEVLVRRVARRLGAAPSPLGFGGPAAQAGARRVESGAAAGNRTRIVSLARGHSAVEPQPPEKLWAGDAELRPRPVTTKNRHLLVIYAIPTRGFMADVSVFRGTPPAKPLNCKTLANASDLFAARRDDTPPAGRPRPSRTQLLLAFVRITWMRRDSRSLWLPFVQCCVLIRTNKKPCLRPASRVWKSLLVAVPYLPASLPSDMDWLCSIQYAGAGTRRNKPPEAPR